eukprot:TRINITY_DN1733_c0_g1_i2.p1 TRINITY_DN1733_c0_g1~~TRINITY_DN1733_c0_g1_i2.p1  ORF type:complete len:358 (+),score=34.33 TRINITY_DN1733_c0_g1_i2:168-1241(+)
MHKVLTEDGYILTIFRIPGRQGESLRDAKEKQKPVILYQHGVLDSSDGIACNDVKKNPGYLMSEMGFDVWFSNSRGNVYSRAHRSLSPKESAFWDFSFEDMGLFDLPAVIDYIIKETKVKGLHLLGHSQGTMLSWVSLIKKKESLKGKVKSFAAWGPVARCDKATSPLVVNVFAGTPLLKILDTFGIHELFPRNFMESEAQKYICKIIPFLCKITLSLISDSDPSLDNEEQLDVLGAHFPSGTSTKDALHIRQIKKQERFASYDYGSSMNLKLYGQEKNPDFDFSQILDIPIGLFVGSKDILGDPEDNHWLKVKLEDAKVLDHYYEYELGHLTYFLPKDFSVMKYFYDTMAFFARHE